MKQITKFFVAALALAGLTGCSDEVEYNSISELPQGIYITIPDPLGGEVPTRALEGGDPSQTEGKLNDLWLIVFNAADGSFFKSDNILANLDPVKFKDEAGPHKTYNITDWFEGTDGGSKYNLYVVANLGGYTNNDNWQAPANEAALRGEILKFRDGENAYLLNHSNVKDKGLPMACLNDDVSVIVTGAGTKKGEGLTVEPGGNARITGNLKFLCSKVRYTLFFDNSADGFSHDVFGNHKLNLTAASVTGVCDGSQTVSIDSRTPDGTFTLSNVALNKVVYPDNPTTYPSDAQKSENLDVTADQTGAKHAWQGVVYLPANAVENKPTTLHFTGDVDGKGKVEYTIPLVPNGANVKALKSGKFYDIAARVTGLETIAVNQPTVETDWNRTQLLYSLMQNLFLKVNPTAIEKVEAGKTYAVYYNTNGLIDFISPVYKDGSKEIKLFEFDTETHPDTVYVNVNPEIKAEWFSSIKDNVANYNYFDVKVGGGVITKKIDIKDLDLHRFLNITPDRMAINMSELVASGSYNNPEKATEFVIETNVESFWIEMDTWPNNSNLAANHLWVEIQDPATEAWSVVKCLTSGATVTDEYKITPNEGERKFRLRYEGLNNGYDIWGAAEQYKLNFKAADAEGATIASLYQVDVVPSRDYYIIHVKSKGNFLSKTPHCYIYQCLEIPSTYTQTYDQTNNNKWFKDEEWFKTHTKRTVPLANWPVAGVRTYVNQGEYPNPDIYDADVSALEYSFTGKVAFRGWDWDLNAKTLRDRDVNVNNDWGQLKDDEGWHHGHAIRFNGDWDVNTNYQNRYNTNVDFFENYRKNVSCDACRTNPNRGWPGIQTEAEETFNDNRAVWSKIELTGIATPGRALIIWTNTHSKVENVTKQYPKGAGVRLFDFPSKEAWICIDSEDSGSQWFQTKADADTYAAKNNY